LGFIGQHMTLRLLSSGVVDLGVIGRWLFSWEILAW